MADLRKTLAGLPWIISLLLVIFVDGLYGGLYRLGGKKTSSKIVGIVFLVSFVLSICSFFALPAFLAWIARVIYVICWIADIITVAVSQKIVLLAD